MFRNLRSISICPRFWPQRTGSGQFKWKGPRCARVHFPATTQQIPALWPTAAGPSWPEPVLGTRVSRDRTNGKRPYCASDSPCSGPGIHFEICPNTIAKLRQHIRLVQHGSKVLFRVPIPECANLAHP